MSLRPEESLCSSLSCCNPWTWPYISMLLQGARLQSLLPQPARPCWAEAGPFPRDTAVREGKGQGVSGQGGKGGLSSCHFLCDYFKIFQSKSLQDGLGCFIRARFWQASPQGGPFHPAALSQSLHTFLSSPDTAQPGPADGQIQPRDTAGTAKPPCRRTGFWFHLRNNSLTLAGDRQSWWC